MKEKLKHLIDPNRDLAVIAIQSIEPKKSPRRSSREKDKKPLLKSRRSSARYRK